MELLQRIDTDCDQLSLRSSPGECPSLAESFLSTQASDMYTDATRRSSFASSTSESPGWYSSKSANTTTPTTPMTSVSPFSIDGQQMKMEHGFDRTHTYHIHQSGLPELDFWMGSHDTNDLSHLTNLSAIPLMDVVGTSEHSAYCSEYPQYPQTVSMSNPALSRSMFDVHDAATMGEDETGLVWSALTSSPPQTIAPSAAFQPILVSSPVSKHEPSTPIRMSTHSSMMFSSSPMGLMSPPILPSQHDVDEAKYEVAEYEVVEADFPRVRIGVDRLHRRGYERKRHVGPSSRPKPVEKRTGMDCDAVIRGNEFPCNYPDCIDKQTGFPKRFKRQEHRKRHEKTVHEKHKHPLHKCWVPGCNTDFSRTDNLKSHLKNTHGKNSPNQRNLYVATLDKHSEYYDPDWEGAITGDGLPIRPKL